MGKRDLPSPAEALRILGERRTRPLRRPPPAATRWLRPVVKGLDERFGQGPQALQARWPEIVGDRLARVTEPVRLVRSRAGPATLELRVAGPVAALVTHQSDDILARVNLVLGGKAAAGRLKIIQGPVRAAPLAPAEQVRSSRRAVPPLDAAREADLAVGLDEVDARLRAALMRLGREVLRRS